MLRRKLLIVFSSLVILLAAMAGSAVWLLQGVLRGLDHLNSEALTLVGEVYRLNQAISAVQVDLYQIQLGKKRHLDALIEDVQTVQVLLGAINSHYVVQGPEVKPHYDSVVADFPEFRRHIGSLATVQDPTLSARHNVEALALVMTMRERLGEIRREANDHARTEQYGLVTRFRWLVLGIAIGFVLVINVSAIALLRAAGMVLKPVDRLLETSRQLTGEQFDHRPTPEQKDEFGELADGYNKLAGLLQAEEQRRMEMIGQVALTMNHELNNAIAGIEMQIQLLSRRSGADDRFESGLRRIRESLRRMAQTVESLKRIRRIVLTDYIAGVKMLDLQRSTEDTSDRTERVSESAENA